MTARLLQALMLLLVAPAAHAADCLTVHQGTDGRGDPSWEIALRQDEWARKICGPLVVKTIRVDDPRPRVNLSATYVEFTTPRDQAERLYNQWVQDRVQWVSRLQPDPGIENPLAKSVLAIESLYRSPRLLSAVLASFGVGAHPSLYREAFTIDVQRGTVVLPSELFRLDAIASLCWRQFASDKSVNGFDTLSRAEMFRDRYPAAEDFTIEDRSRDWAITDTGVTIEFGSPFGYVHGPYVGVLGNDELRSAARPGVSVPP